MAKLVVRDLPFMEFGQTAGTGAAPGILVDVFLPVAHRWLMAKRALIDTGCDGCIVYPSKIHVRSGEVDENPSEHTILVGLRVG
jgi:hypothetical protein